MTSSIRPRTAPRSRTRILTVLWLAAAGGGALAAQETLPDAPVGAPPAQIIRSDDDAVNEGILEIDAMAARQDWKAAAERCQRILDRADSACFADRRHTAVEISARDAVLRRLAAWPAEGIGAYRAIFDGLAGERLAEARTSGLRGRIRDVAVRYRHTRHGPEALLELAFRALEEGDAPEAVFWFREHRRSYAGSPEGDRRLGAVLAGEALALRVLDDGEGLAALLAVVERDHAGVVAAFAGVREPVSGIIGRLVTSGGAGDLWTAPHGSERRTRRASFAAPGRLSTAWATPPPLAEPGGAWLPGRSTPDAFRSPLVRDGRVYTHDRRGALALDLGTGRTIWFLDFLHSTRSGGPDLRNDGGTRLEHAGAIGLCRYVMVLEAGMAPRREETRLVALDLATGAVAWTRGGPDDPDPRLRALHFTGAPLASGGRILTGAVRPAVDAEAWLLAFDEADGSLLWITHAASGPSMPFADTPRENGHDTMPLAADGGLVYFGTHLGFIACLETATGLPRWRLRYDRIPLGGRRHRFQDVIAPRSWRGAPVFLEQDILVAAPEDAPALLIARRDPPLEPERLRRGDTYLVLQTYPESGMNWFDRVLGVRDGLVVIGGRDDAHEHVVVRALSPLARERLVAWTSEPLDGELQGRGVVTAEGALAATARYIYSFDRTSGGPGDPCYVREDDGADTLGVLVPTSRGLLVGGRGRILCLRAP